MTWSSSGGRCAGSQRAARLTASRMPRHLEEAAAAKRSVLEQKMAAVSKAAADAIAAKSGGDLENPTIHSEMARTVHRLLCRPDRTVAPVSQFLPGRQSYEFEVDLVVSRALPTTLIHAATDARRQRQQARTAPPRVAQHGLMHATATAACERHHQRAAA
jgi:hypothetical protein